eukprot:3738055-Ditylum_brightwellii.AAC.1
MALMITNDSDHGGGSIVGKTKEIVVTTDYFIMLVNGLNLEKNIGDGANCYRRHGLGKGASRRGEGEANTETKKLVRNISKERVLGSREDESTAKE